MSPLKKRSKTDPGLFPNMKFVSKHLKLDKIGTHVTIFRRMFCRVELVKLGKSKATQGNIWCKMFSKQTERMKNSTLQSKWLIVMELSQTRQSLQIDLPLLSNGSTNSDWAPE